MTAAARSVPQVVQARLLRTCSDPDQFPPPSGIEVVFAGRSNAGKSSLMNALMKRRQLVRTSSTPGCTRQIGFYEARTSAETLTLVDLPGYGFTRRSKSEQRLWSGLVESYLLQRPTLRAMLLLVDVRRGLQQEEKDLLDLVASGRPEPKVTRVVVATNFDKVNRSARKLVLARLCPCTDLPLIGCSVRIPETCDRLWARLRAELGLTAARAAGVAPRPV
jgi:GTP-binding protein